MTTAGDKITKSNITEAMASIRNSYNSGIVWHTGNNPFSQSNPLGGDSGGYATQDLAGDISDVNVTASTITNNFRTYANLLSRIRNVRLLKWYQNQGDPRSSLQYDSTQITNLNANYEWPRQNINDGGIGVGGEPNINVAQLNRFVNYLSDNINAYRGSTVTIEEFYCHSNCHGSCHGSI